MSLTPDVHETLLALTLHWYFTWVDFSPLHGMQTRSSDEKAVRPSARLSVYPSVKRVDCDKTEERSVQIFIPYETLFTNVTLIVH